MKLKLFIMLCLLAMPFVNAMGEDYTDEQGVVYTFNDDDQTCTVSGHTDTCTGAITIPVSVNGYRVNSIGHDAFAECSGLTSVTIPEGVTTIDPYAFFRTFDLTSVNIPNTVSSIGDWALGHTGITSLIIPSSVTTIGIEAFTGSFHVESIQVESGNTKYDSRDNCNAIIETATNTLIRGCINTVIPNSVTSIGSCAFKCSNLTTINIPRNVTCIGDEAFNDNAYLISVYCYPENVPTTGADVFTWSCIEKTTLYVPARSIGSYSLIASWGGFKSIEAMKYCDDRGVLYALNDDGETYTVSGHTDTCTGAIKILKSIHGCGVISIGHDAFAECSGLTSVTIPEGVTTIGPYAFFRTFDLTSVNIPNTVSSIGDWALGHTGITSLIIPSSVTTIGIEAFTGSFHVESIQVESGNTKYDSRDNCNAIVETATNTLIRGCINTIIPNSVTSIGSYAFKCSSLTTINIPSNVTSIGDEAFNDNAYLISVYCYPEHVPTTGADVFTWSRIEKTTLYVPFNSIKAYSETIAWNGFMKILSIDGTKFKLEYMIDGAPYKTAEYNFGDAITLEPAPTKEGYTFAGWSDAPKTMPAENMTITGTFTINIYKLIYMVDGAEYKKYDIEYGAIITPEVAPMKEGYIFSGWSEIPEKMPAKDVTIKGTFSKGAYKLIYMVDDVVYKTIGYDYGDAIIPEPAPTKEGYTFSGWNDVPKTMPAENVTVKGTFIINKYKLIYMVDGETYKTYDVEYGAIITPEAEPAKDGYTFSGWSIIPDKMPANNVTITGSFSKGTHKLTYMVDGAVYKIFSYDYGDAIIPEPAPTKVGYAFSGWSDIPKTMPDMDITITGTFVKKEGQQQENPENQIVPQQPDNPQLPDDNQQSEEQEQELTKEDVVYEVEGNHASVSQSDDVSGNVKIEAFIVINGKSYEVTIIGKSAFKGCANLTSVEIPSSVTYISENAFDGCTSLRKINIGKGILNIASKAFANIFTYNARTRGDDEGLHVYCLADKIPTTAADVFEGTDIAHATLHVPESLIDNYKMTAPWSGFGNIESLSGTGINAIIMEMSNVQIFDMQGNKLDNVRKGLNIIRMSDGKVKKVIVK